MNDDELQEGKISAPYPLMNTTSMGTDIMQYFVYANEVTNGFFVPLMILAFFIVVFLGSLFMQMRISTRVRLETSLAAASFSSLGFAIILAQRTGMVNAIWFFILFATTIASVLWLVMSPD